MTEPTLERFLSSFSQLCLFFTGLLRLLFLTVVIFVIVVVCYPPRVKNSSETDFKKYDCGQTSRGRRFIIGDAQQFEYLQSVCGKADLNAVYH